MQRSRFSLMPRLLALLLPMALCAAEGDGGGQAGATPVTPSVDVDAIKQAALAEVQAVFSAQLKEATGFESLEAFKADKLKAEGKLQELADQHAAQAQTYKGRFEQAAIDSALLAAAAGAVDPATVADLLRHKAVCDDAGKVTVDGKTAAEAVKALLDEKKFLAKAEGDNGSGAAQTVTAAAKAESDTLSPLERLKAARKSGAN